MSDVAALDAAIANLQTVLANKQAADTAEDAAIVALLPDVTTAFNKLQQDIATLKAQIAAGGGTPIDTSSEITTINNFIAAINTSITTTQTDTTNITSADAAAKLEN